MSLSLRQIYNLGEDTARAFLTAVRWGEEIACPGCGSKKVKKIAARTTIRCNECRKHFSVTSGTLISGAKLSCSDIIAAAFLFCANAKGISSVQYGRLLGVQQKSAFLLMHKFREAIVAEMQTVRLSGMVEIDGATFGGHSRLENSRRNGFEQRIYQKNFKHRRVIVVARERDGRTVPFVGRKESDAVAAIMEVVRPGSVIIADQAHAWDGLGKLYDTLRVSHDYTFSHNGACTNMAESFWSILRKTHDGVHHKWGADQMYAYACEIAWRQDTRFLDEKDRIELLLRLVFSAEVSRKWSAYQNRELPLDDPSDGVWGLSDSAKRSAIAAAASEGARKALSAA